MTCFVVELFKHAHLLHVISLKYALDFTANNVPSYITLQYIVSHYDMYLLSCQMRGRNTTPAKAITVR